MSGREVLHEGKWLRLVRIGRWEHCERTHGGDGMAVLVIAATPDDAVLFVEQYRVPLGARTIEFPAGLVGDGGHDTDLVETARRELLEETGWLAADIDLLLVGPTSAGMTNERIALLRARNLSKVHDGGGVDGEDIVVHAVPRCEAPAWLLRRQAEGCELDLKLWAGLWLLDHAPDGTPLPPG